MKLLLSLAVTVGLLCVSVAPAGAATATSSYAAGGAFGQGGGDVTPAGNGIAVAQANGNIFIAQHNVYAVGVYAPDPGSGGTVLTSAELGTISLVPLNLTVDPDDDALYVSDNSGFGTAIAKALSDGAPTPTYTLDSGFAVAPGIIGANGMAVDPTTHDLLVVDGNANRVVRLSPSTGAEISSFNGSGTAAGAFQAPGSIAIGPTGTIYVVDTVGARVERFSSAGTSLGALTLPDGTQPLSVAVNPQNGNVVVELVRGNQTYIQGFSVGGAQTFFARVPGGVSVSGFGVAWHAATNRIYVDVGGGFARTMVPATQPGVDAPVATPGRNTVHLTADVDPGGEQTTARFEYCSATAACGSYEVSDPSDPSNPWQRGPDHAVTSHGQLVDDLPLGSNASWRVRVSADNTAGAETTSSTVNFDSPLLAPGVTTGTAGSVTDSEAELTGTIDTMGAQATYHFEYGLTTNYGSRVPVAVEAPAGKNRTPRTVTKAITGLQPGTTYHYRLVAQNSAGDNADADRTFTTAGPDDVAPHRGYEQVTPADKQGAQVVSDFHVQAARDGSAIAVATSSATPDANGSRFRENYLSRRGTSDWSDWLQTDAPQDAVPGLWDASTTAVSSDFEHALVLSNRALATGGFVGGGNIYIKDLRTGAYTFVAGAPGSNAYRALASVQSSEQVYMAGAPDFSWILFWGAAPFLPEATGGPAVYRWSRTDGLAIESRLPDGTVAPSAVQMPGARREFPSASVQGDVVAFSAGGIYRRANGQTTAISVSRIAGDPPDPQGGLLDAVTPDGRYVFFNSAVPLTDDAVSSADSGFLAYRYDAVTDELRFIAPVTPSNENAVYGVSADGQTVYFDDGNGAEVWRNGQVHNVTADRVLQFEGFQTYITANGRYFAWIGNDAQAHRYDADTDQSVCVSCPSDGSPGARTRLFAGGRGIGNRAPRAMTETGLMFFDTAARLVMADHNGTKDVYAYGDRPTLISPGDGAFDAFFVDASDDGKDVFFQTDEGLVSRDTDESSDVYDARVGGGLPAQSPLPPPAPCVRAECGELGSGPVVSPPASSSTTTGSGGSQRTNQEKVVLSVSKVSFGSKAVRIAFKASQRGRVKVTGARVSTTVRNVAKAGSYSVSVPLSKKARALARGHRKFKVSLKVSLSGGWGSASAKYSRTLGN
jgi:sugar lactone lactonase YvrE